MTLGQFFNSFSYLCNITAGAGNLLKRYIRYNKRTYTSRATPFAKI